MTDAVTLKLRVFNRALYECEADRIETLGQTSSEGWRVLDQLYADIVDEMIEDADWDWAQATISSTGTETAAVSRFRYEHTLAASYPALIRLVSVHRAGHTHRDAPLANDWQSGVLYTNDETVEVDYISSTLGRDETKWPAQVRKLVSLMLADAAVSRLNQSQSVAERVERRLRVARHNAVSLVRAQRAPRKPPTTSWVRAHYGGSSRR